MNLQEVIDAINEEWARKIEDIKAEIESLKGTFPSETYLKIIDKHISGKENE